ncbi:PilT/PilU family type 4a pilus ATPase [Ectothiorhodospira lacustris]|uniref:PilT/PilU family type 4a pilus ATPase n=1 Tax=Ectothiorhodospira lacustris TaxID=2899127 RepID=UPI001EE97C0D|nr:PilT/PilU family type 4a pilus ATPase [Ectothiorhodospira lacustris]MCG5500129.1 PilT/PilU family type 4a pilus ATPase [Ectothiorhodospira lacustris]MCG5510786.1 PilT/PilU family type 4a pilus ATPase [Ectothiorhodospira lacustris]MCG5522518.1 PilT/PilU family type 4a pilus ATPase [Ectothiorhodospira lacustris]
MDRDKAIRFMHDLLRTLLSKKGSDLFITVGAPPSMKIDGKMTPITNQPLSPAHTQVLVRSIMNDRQAAEFERTQECNFAISLPGISRFRVNAFTQRGSSGMVLRVITSDIPSLDDLGLPIQLKDVSMTRRGLVIFVGGTGSGKSTSLAAMVGYRNQNSYGHIVTIEDPIEFVHSHVNCLVTQREVGVDTENYEIALKNTLRQAPDVILIGEIRDRETMDYAIAFAETGHLCLTTLHANSTNQALDRIINFFPEERRQQLLMDLSLNLKSVVSQRLIPLATGKGRVPAVEVMINTPLMSDLIFKGEIHEMKSLMAKSTEAGMQTFDQALFQLFEIGRITYEDALRNADSVNDLRLRIKLDSKRARGQNLLDDTGGLEVEATPEESGLLK